MRLGPEGMSRLVRGVRAFSLAATAAASVWLVACGGDESQPTTQTPTTMTLPLPSSLTHDATTIPTHSEPVTPTNPNGTSIPTTPGTTTTLTTTTLPSPTVTATDTGTAQPPRSPADLPAGNPGSAG
jgi:hypothetical protein